jgi:hypothetical protein
LISTPKLSQIFKKICHGDVTWIAQRLWRVLIDGGYRKVAELNPGWCDEQRRSDYRIVY